MPGRWGFAGELGLALGLSLGLMAGTAGAQDLPLTYFCRDADDTGYFLRLNQGGVLEVQQQNTQPVHSGNFTLQPGHVSLSLPPLGFAEQSVRAVQRREFLIAFDTPSIRCLLFSQPKGPSVQGYVKCPKINYLPGISYEENAFEFYPERGVKRRKWTELLGAADTLYRETFGIYVIEGNQLWMAFGWDEEDTVLTGTVLSDQSFTVNELDPSKGPCAPQ